MSDLKIISNGHHRDVLNGWDLTPTEREDFDYLDWAGIEDGTSGASFFRYRGQLYELGDIELAPPTLRELGWDGFQPDSYFSGIAVRYVDEWEGVVVALVLS